MPNSIRVLVCNRHNLFRKGIKALFPGTSVIEIVGEASTTRQALKLLASLHPDVVLLDTCTPDSTGSEATRSIKAFDPDVAVLVVSLSDDELLISACLDAGASGFVRGNDEPLKLRHAIDTAYARHPRAAA